MIPILYEGDETEFRSNGIGRLSDAIRCEVTEKRNGTYELELDYPISGSHYNDICEGDIIYTTHDETRRPQPFDIYARSAPLNGVVTFYAHHISYRLGKIVAKPFTASSCAQVMTVINNKSMNDNPFTFWTDKETTGNFNCAVPRTVKDILGGSEGSVLDVYGKAEYEWDGFTVKLHTNRGQDKDITIRYGKNLTGALYETDTSGMYSAVAPFWQSVDGSEVVFLDEGIVLPDEPYTEASDLVTELGDFLATESGEALIAVEQTIEAVPLDLSDQWDSAPTQQQLRDKAKQALVDTYIPDENIEINFIQLWQTEEYANIAPLERVGLCDKIYVDYDKIGLKHIRQQVISVTYDSLLDRYTAMELGTARVSFADTIRATIENTILKKVPSSSDLERAIDHATSLITGGLGGHVVFGMNADGEPNEILIMDTTDTATAVNVLRINENGIGFSSTGYQGPFRSAWTLDGQFVADFITAGTLSGNRLKAGIISDRLGRNYWNLETGEFSISYDPGSGADVTQADLQRVENNARTWSEDAQEAAEANSKDYVDTALLDYDTGTVVDGKIDASIDGIRTEFTGTFAVKEDATTNIVRYIYQSTSPTQLFGGQWQLASQTVWQEGRYVWEKLRYIHADASYTESDPVCISGNTGEGQPGQDGEDAISPYITTNTSTSMPKGSAVNVTFTAHVQQGSTVDIDPQGYLFNYTWYAAKDNAQAVQVGTGKTYTATINDNYCSDRASVYVGIEEVSS